MKQCVYVLSILERKNIKKVEFGSYLRISFCGYYQGHKIKSIKLWTNKELAISQSHSNVLCKVLISRLEKTEIVGTLYSIKFL